MSERLLRHQIETVHGVRSVRKARVGRDRGAWVVTLFTLDTRQRHEDVATRFAHLGRVSSCTEFMALDRAERKFVVVLVVKEGDAAVPVDGGLESEASVR